MSLKITKLSKKYGQKWVLRDVNLSVDAGMIFGIFGESGSGKSTLIDAIACSESVNGGEVSFNGKDVTGKSRDFHRPKTQNRSIWKSLFGPRMLSDAIDGSANQKAVEAALERADHVLLLDNSLCGMDVAARDETVAKIRKAVREKGLSVVFASNNFEDILLLCDEAVVLSNGEIVQTGSPQDIYEIPSSAVVAHITGRNNLFTARRLTSSKADIPEFVTIDGEHHLFARKIERGALGALNQNVTLAIRPEQVSISFGASFPADNLLKATVMGVQFLGPTTLIGLDSNGLKLEAMVLRLVGLDVGEECMVGLPLDRIMIFR